MEEHTSAAAVVKTYGGDVIEHKFDMDSMTFAQILDQKGQSFDFDEYYDSMLSQYKHMKVEIGEGGKLETAAVAVAHAFLGPIGAQWRKQKTKGIKIVFPDKRELFIAPASAAKDHGAYENSFAKMQSVGVRTLANAVGTLGVKDRLLTTPLSQSVVKKEIVKEWYRDYNDRFEYRDITQMSLAVINSCLQRPQDNPRYHMRDLSAAIKIVTSENLTANEKDSFIKQVSSTVYSLDEFKFWLELLGEKSTSSMVKLAIEEVREATKVRPVKLKPTSLSREAVQRSRGVTRKLATTAEAEDCYEIEKEVEDLRQALRESQNTRHDITHSYNRTRKNVFIDPGELR